jgi:phenylalanyl-tRNA synthetase beta chain
MLHPQWQQRYDLPRPAGLFELDAAPLQRRGVPALRELSRFPLVRRDIAVVVDEKTAQQDLLDALREASPEIVSEVELFDVYRGKGIDSDKKSLAFRVLMQDTRRTLTDKDADDAVTYLTELLAARFNATLRT